MAVDWDRLVLGPTHAAFGEPAEISRGGGAPLQVPDAIFDLVPTEVQMPDGRTMVSGFRPTLGIRQASLPEGVVVRQGDDVQVRGQSYRVADVQPDSLGHVLLVLAGA